jgi:hypothetical protein
LSQWLDFYRVQPIAERTYGGAKGSNIWRSSIVCAVLVCGLQRTVLTEVMHGIDWRVWAVVECDICARSDARRSSYLRRGTWPACRSTSYLEAWSRQIVVKEPSNEDAQCSERDSTNGLRCPGHISVAMESGRKKDRRSMLIGSFHPNRRHPGDLQILLPGWFRLARCVYDIGPRCCDFVTKPSTSGNSPN